MAVAFFQPWINARLISICFLLSLLLSFSTDSPHFLNNIFWLSLPSFFSSPMKLRARFGLEKEFLPENEPRPMNCKWNYFIEEIRSQGPHLGKKKRKNVGFSTLFLASVFFVRGSSDAKQCRFLSLSSWRSAVDVTDVDVAGVGSVEIRRCRFCSRPLWGRFKRERISGWMVLGAASRLGVWLPVENCKFPILKTARNKHS